MSRGQNRTGGGSSGFLRAIFSALKFVVMLMFFFPPLLPFLRPSSVWQRLTRELLTFEARALGSNYLLHKLLYASPLPTQRHDARMDVAVWHRRVSSGLPLPQAVLPSLLHLLPESPVKAQGSWSLNWVPSEHSGSKTCSEAGPAPRRAPRQRCRGLARVSLREGRRGSNQPSTNLGGLLPIPLLRRLAWDCRRARKTEFRELNYLSEEKGVPTPCSSLDWA